MNLLDKIRELALAADGDPQFRAQVEADAQALMEQMRDWSCATQVPLARVAQIIAGLVIEPDHNVRRVRATDAVKLKDGLG